MKGIILAAGKGTRLYPASRAVNKQLIPVYDKPLIYYPLSVLMQAGINEILIVSSEKDLGSFQNLLGDGSEYGLKISYTIQKVQRGIADAFLLGEEFIGDDSVCLILGDNIFWSKDFAQKVRQCTYLDEGAIVFGLPSDNPSQFGVVEFNDQAQVLSIEEKPLQPKSNYIVPGLYFFDRQAVNNAKKVKPSARGELEITELINIYLKQEMLSVTLLSDETVWFDAGTPDRILESSNMIKELQMKENTIIACVEELAYENDWINYEKFIELGQASKQTIYGKYILSKIQQ